MSPISWKTRARSPLVRSAASSASTSAGGSSSWAASEKGSSSAPVGIAAMVPARPGTGRERPMVRSSGGDDLVAAPALGEVQRPVGVLDDGGDRLVRTVGDRGADRDAHRADPEPMEIQPADGRADPLADIDCDGERRV